MISITSRLVLLLLWLLQKDCTSDLIVELLLLQQLSAEQSLPNALVGLTGQKDR